MLAPKRRMARRGDTTPASLIDAALFGIPVL